MPTVRIELNRGDSVVLVPNGAGLDEIRVDMTERGVTIAKGAPVSSLRSRGESRSGYYRSPG